MSDEPIAFSRQPCDLNESDECHLAGERHIIHDPDQGRLEVCVDCLLLVNGGDGREVEPSMIDHLRAALGKIDPARAATLLGLDEDDAATADLDAWADNLNDMSGDDRFEEVASVLLFILEGWAW